MHTEVGQSWNMLFSSSTKLDRLCTDAHLFVMGWFENTDKSRPARSEPYFKYVHSMVMSPAPQASILQPKRGKKKKHECMQPAKNLTLCNTTSRAPSPYLFPPSFSALCIHLVWPSSLVIGYKSASQVSLMGGGHND